MLTQISYIALLTVIAVTTMSCRSGQTRTSLKPVVPPEEVLHRFIAALGSADLERALPMVVGSVKPVPEYVLYAKASPYGWLAVVGPETTFRGDECTVSYTVMMGDEAHVPMLGRPENVNLLNSGGIWKIKVSQEMKDIGKGVLAKKVSSEELTKRSLVEYFAYVLTSPEEQRRRLQSKESDSAPNAE